MDLTQIKYFCATAEALNFTRAAESCGVTQPSLTRAIQKLEDELGGPLFRREGRRTHLTELGRMIRPRLEQALSLTELAKDEALDFSRMTNASLTVGVMCTIGPSRLIALVNHLTKKVPSLRLKLKEGSGRAVIERLLDGEYDVAIVGLPDYPDSIHAYPLYDERYIIAFPAGHRFEGMEKVTRADLDGEDYLLRLNCEYPEYVKASDDAANISINIKYESEHEDWIQAMIVAGLGCASMPEFTPLSPELRTRPLVKPELTRTISVASVRGRLHTPVVDVFQRLCRSISWQDGPHGH